MKSPLLSYWGGKLTTILVLSLIFPAAIFAQTIAWDKTYGGRNYDFLSVVLATSDGGSLLAGGSRSRISGNKTALNKGLDDYWVVKLRADGSKAWDYSYGTQVGEGLAMAQPTPDGGYILGGTSGSGINGDKTEASKGSADYWIVKINATGQKEWDKTIGGPDADGLTALRVTPDGGYILGGYSFSGIGGDKTEADRGGQDPIGSSVADYWVVKLSAQGTVEWDKTLGGDGDDKLSTLLPTVDGGYLVGGDSNTGINGDKTEDQKGGNDTDAGPYDDFWLVKLNAQGKIEWDKTYGGNGYDFLASLELTQDGGYILGGTSTTGRNGDKTEGSRGNSDYWIVKLNAAGEKVWDKTIGGDYVDDLSAVHELPNGNYFLAGSSRSAKGQDKSQDSKGHYDYWIVQLDATGKKVWDKTIGGDQVDALASVAFTSDGSYLLGGSSASGKSGDKTEANKRVESKGDSYDYWVVKVKDETTPTTTQWNQRYGGAGRDNFTGVIKTTDGGFLSGGYTESGSSGDKSQASQGKNDYWIVKSDQNGKKLWDKRYGGNEDDYLTRVIQTQDGGYLLAGSSYSGKSGDKSEASRGDRDYWLVKVDSKGNKEWDKAFGGSGPDELVKVVQLASGEYVLGGSSGSPVSGEQTQPSQGGTDLWLVKISATGSKLWDKRYGSPNSENLGSFTETSDGGFFLGSNTGPGQGGDKTQPGWKGTDIWAVQTDKDGNLLWEKTLGGYGQDGVFSVRQIPGGNLYLAGITNSRANGEVSQNSRGGYDYWLVLLDKAGTKLWDKRFGGSKDDVLRASTYTPEGHIILAGTSSSNISGDKSQDSQGAGDYWVVEVDEKGNKVQDQRFGGNGYDELRTVTLTKEGGLLLGGRSNSGVSGDLTQPSQGRTDYWLVKVAPNTNFVVAERTAAMTEVAASPTELPPLMAYPNPFQEWVSIRFTVPQTQAATVRVLDSQGRELKTLFEGEAQANHTYELEWQAGKQANGFYLLQLQTSTQRNTQKLLLSK